MNSSLELLYLIIFTGILAVAYSYLLSGQILSSSAGNDKMKEIAEAIQIGWLYIFFVISAFALEPNQ